jgi:hypothetical protein
MVQEKLERLAKKNHPEKVLKNRHVAMQDIAK